MRLFSVQAKAPGKNIERYLCKRNRHSYFQFVNVPILQKEFIISKLSRNNLISLCIKLLNEKHNELKLQLET